MKISSIQVSDIIDEVAKHIQKRGLTVQSNGSGNWRTMEVTQGLMI